MAYPLAKRRLAGRFQVGIDIGQAVDPSAVVVVETGERQTGMQKPGESFGTFVDVLETTYAVRYLHRLALGLSYGQIADQIAAILTAEQLAGRECGAWLDYTGVGRPVYEMIAERLRNKAPGVALRAITFTHGREYDRAKGLLGKEYLVSRLQAHVQWGRIALPPTPEAVALQQELQNYRINVNQDAQATFGAKIGAHDDLVTGLGLATLEDPRDYVVTYGPQLFGEHSS